MLRVVLAVIAGFFLAGFLSLGSDAAMKAAFPARFGPEMQDTQLLTVSLVYTILWSAVAGFVAGLIARERGMHAAVALAILLFLFSALSLLAKSSGLPLWFRIAILLLATPAIVAGGWYHKRRRLKAAA